MKKSETKNQGNKKLVATVDATPSWASLAPMFIEWIQDGNSQQHMDASENIRRMAEISDAYRANEKKINMHDELVEVINNMLTEVSPAYNFDMRNASEPFQKAMKLIKQAECKK